VINFVNSPSLISHASDGLFEMQMLPLHSTQRYLHNGTIYKSEKACLYQDISDGAG
jgi:hypothetical protein